MGVKTKKKTMAEALSAKTRRKTKKKKGFFCDSLLFSLFVCNMHTESLSLGVHACIVAMLFITDALDLSLRSASMNMDRMSGFESRSESAVSTPHMFSRS